MNCIGFNPKFTITNRITAGLTRIERARGFLEAAALSEAWVREMGRRALILEAHHTTHIDGTRLTLEQAERLLAGTPVPEADPDDVRELLNCRKAFEFVSEYLEDGGPITETEREKIYDRFRRNELHCIVLSKVGNFAIDLPDADVLIQVSGMFGSRQEEAQRLGRILRPKGDGRTAHCFTLVSRDTREEKFAHHRKLFLTEQGYSYQVVIADAR